MFPCMEGFIRLHLSVFPIHHVIRILKQHSRTWRVPSVTQIARSNHPYRVFISTLLSLRTKDETTLEASKRLFRLADSLQKMLQLSEKQIQKAIYPVGFY